MREEQTRWLMRLAKGGDRFPVLAKKLRGRDGPDLTAELVLFVELVRSAERAAMTQEPDVAVPSRGT